MQLCLACYTIKTLRNLTLKHTKNPTSFIDCYGNDGDCSRMKPELMGAASVCVSCVQLNHIKFLDWSLTTDSCGALASAARNYFHIISSHLCIPSALMPSRHFHTPYWCSALLMCSRIQYLTIYSNTQYSFFICIMMNCMISFLR